MFSSRDNPLLAALRDPEIVSEKLFPGKMPAGPLNVSGPVVNPGQYNWEPVNSMELSVAIPISESGCAILLSDNNYKKVAVANLVIPSISESDALRARALIPLKEFELPNVSVIIGSVISLQDLKTISDIVKDLGVRPTELKVLKAYSSPAYHLLVHKGELLIVDSRVIGPMSDEQEQLDKPAWGPLSYHLP